MVHQEQDGFCTVLHAKIWTTISFYSSFYWVDLNGECAKNGFMLRVRKNWVCEKWLQVQTFNRGDCLGALIALQVMNETRNHATMSGAAFASRFLNKSFTFPSQTFYVGANGLHFTAGTCPRGVMKYSLDCWPTEWNTWLCIVALFTVDRLDVPHRAATAFENFVPGQWLGDQLATVGHAILRISRGTLCTYCFLWALRYFPART